MSAFSEAKEINPKISLAKMMLPALLLMRHGTTELNIVGDGLKRFNQLKGQRVIICANHSSWDDTDMIFAFSNLVKENFSYLAAWEVLHSNFGHRTWLQHVGCYSIIRGYPDRASFKATRNLLVKGKSKVVIFPEGEISHDSTSLLPIRSAMSQMAFSALHKLEKDGHLEPIYILPLALRYKIKGDAQPVLEEAMGYLEQALGLRIDHSIPLYKRVKKASRLFMSNLERQYNELPDPDLSFDNRLDSLRSQIVEGVADQLHIDLPPGLTHLEYAHILQSALYALTTGAEAGRAEYSKKQLENLSKDLHRVVDFISIYDGFVSDSSSPERLAEVLDLLEAEILKTRSNKGVKVVSFDLGEPINLLDYHQQYKANKAKTEATVLELYRSRMLSLLAH